MSLNIASKLRYKVAGVIGIAGYYFAITDH